MRIALLTADYLPNVGGITAHVAELGRALNRAGHEVEVWVWNPSPEEPRHRSTLPVRPLRTAPWPGVVPGRAILEAPTVARAIRRQMVTFSPDVIHVHTMGPLVLGARLAVRDTTCRVVFTNHSSGYLKSSTTKLGRLHLRASLRWADQVISPSRELQRRSRLIAGMSRCHYIPNGVRTDLAPTPEYDDSVAPFILTTRRFVRKNGLRYLVEAMPDVLAAHPRTQLVMAGGLVDDEWDHVSEQIARLGLADHVQRLGARTNEEVQALVVTADVVVVPSLVEATSISVLEAMAAGRAIVGSNVGGIPELIEHGVSGILVPPGSPGDLASALVSLLGDPVRRQTLGARARRSAVQDFDWAHIAERTVEVYLTDDR